MVSCKQSPERSEAPPRAHQTRLDPIVFQSLNGTIHRKTLGDASKIDNQRPAEEDFVVTAKKNVTRSSSWTEAVAALWEIIPFCEQSSDRDIKSAVAFQGEPLCRLDDLPGPGMHGHTLWESIAIHA